MSVAIPVWPLFPAVAESSAADLVAASGVSALSDAAHHDTWLLQDPASEALLPVIEKAAPTEAGILLQGDSGADRELIARHIHALSAHRNGPFVVLHCAAWAEQLRASGKAETAGLGNGCESSDAWASWLRQAHLGTLLLEDVHELPVHLQSQLVGILCRQSTQAFASTKPAGQDARILASTSKDLLRAVAAGHFREDLYYQLAVIVLPVLPLRQRPGDILPLARHFIHIWCKRLHHAPLELNAKAQKKLLAHAWPGNTLELECVLHRSLLLCPSMSLGEDDIDFKHAAHDTSLIDGEASQQAQFEQETNAQQALEDALDAWCDVYAQGLEQRVQQALLRKVWHRNRFNQVHTARQLGISRSVVRTRLQRMGELDQASELTASNSTDAAAAAN